MKSLRWLLMAALLLSVHCRGWPAFPADPPAKVAVVKTTARAIPQSILDALEKCEQDRINIMAADISLGIAKVAVERATADKASATAASAIDQANFLKLWAELYGPTPQPPQPPEPPKPPEPPQPPQPPVVVLPQLTLVTATGSWCQACTQTDGDTVPGLKVNAGIMFKRILYTDDEAAKIFPQSALVPRWVLTRPDGKVEKKIGYMTPAEVDQWIGKGAKP